MASDRTTNELRQTAEDEAAAWIARLRAADVTDRERAEYALWLNSSAIRKDAFDHMLDLWSLAGGTEAASDHLAQRQALDASSANASSANASSANASSANGRTTNATSQRRRWISFGMAAAVLGLAANVGVWLFDRGQTLETQPGELRRVMLADGSNVHLNTDTELTVALREDRRVVRLARGEAYFEVAKDAGRPFVVETNTARTRVVGTAFAVRSFSESTLVVVSHGEVIVGRLADSPPEMQSLQANQIATVTANAVSPAIVDADALTRWRGGQLVYDGVPLRDVLADLDRYLPANIVLQDESIGSIPVFAVVQLQDQAAMLDALAETLSLQWSQVDRLIFVRKR